MLIPSIEAYCQTPVAGPRRASGVSGSRIAFNFDRRGRSEGYSPQGNGQARVSAIYSTSPFWSGLSHRTLEVSFYKHSRYELTIYQASRTLRLSTLSSPHFWPVSCTFICIPSTHSMERQRQFCDPETVTPDTSASFFACILHFMNTYRPTAHRRADCGRV